MLASISIDLVDMQNKTLATHIALEIRSAVTFHSTTLLEVAAKCKEYSFTYSGQENLVCLADILRLKDISYQLIKANECLDLLDVNDF
jgi:hypothetical protein